MSGSILRKAVVGGLAFLPAFPLWGADESYATVANLIERVERLEKRGTAMLELAGQNEQLRGEVQSLRGEIEELNHKIETLSKQQHDMYLDLEGRLKPAAPASAEEKSADGGEAAEEVQESGEAADAPKPTASASKAGAEEVRAAYQKAFDTLKETRYKEAIALFKQFLANYPGREYADNAQYWLGEAYHVTKGFQSAREAFRKLIDTYPQSPKLPDAWLKLGLIDYDTQQWASARKVFGEVKTRFPNSKAASAADSRLQKMKQEGH